MQNYLYMLYFLSGERVHHFRQIIKGICDPQKGLEGLRGIPVIHFITGLGNGGRKLKMPSEKGGAKLLIFSLYSHLGNKCFKLGKIIKLIKFHLKIIKATF